ncbi:MAG TPA: GAF domain-containing protein, partial [Chloroflexi bacterium]|nr:GAF domain-containing protein [Chloroflexota bacterium]
ALIGGHGGGMYLCDHKARVARCEVSHRTDRDYRGTELAFGEGAAGVVAETGEPLVITDYANWEHRSSKFEGDPFLSVLSAPMRWQRQVTGVIHILRKKGAPPFTPADLELLILFADQAAVVLENARLLEDVRMRMRQLDQLNALTRAALGAKDLGDLVERVCEHMTALVQAAKCHMAFWDSRSQEVVPAGGPSQATAGSASQAMDADAVSLLMEALRTEAPVACGGRDAADVLEGTSMLALPLVAGGERLGGLLLELEGWHVLAEHEQALCEQAAGQVALALAKMQALEGERRRSRELEAVREASLSVTSNLELETVLDSILASALELVAADDAHIFLYEGGKLSFGAAQWAAGVQGEPYKEPREDGLTYAVARSGEAMVIPNVKSIPCSRNGNGAEPSWGFP